MPFNGIRKSAIRMEDDTPNATCHSTDGVARQLFRNPALARQPQAAGEVLGGAGDGRVAG